MSAKYRDFFRTNSRDTLATLPGEIHMNVYSGCIGYSSPVPTDGPAVAGPLTTVREGLSVWGRLAVVPYFFANCFDMIHFRAPIWSRFCWTRAGSIPPSCNMGISSFSRLLSGRYNVRYGIRRNHDFCNLLVDFLFSSPYPSPVVESRLVYGTRQ